MSNFCGQFPNGLQRKAITATAFPPASFPIRSLLLLLVQCCVPIEPICHFTYLTEMCEIAQNTQTAHAHAIQGTMDIASADSYWNVANWFCILSCVHMCIYAIHTIVFLLVFFSSFSFVAAVLVDSKRNANVQHTFSGAEPMFCNMSSDRNGKEISVHNILLAN